MNTIQLWRPVRLEAFGGLITKSRPTLVTPWAVAVHGKNTRVGSHFLLQGIFPTQGLNPGLLHCRLILYGLSYQGPPPKQPSPRNLPPPLWSLLSEGTGWTSFELADLQEEESGRGHHACYLFLLTSPVRATTPPPLGRMLFHWVFLPIETWSQEKGIFPPTKKLLQGVKWFAQGQKKEKRWALPWWSSG